MKMFNKIMTAAAIASLATVPAMAASTNPAASLSVAHSARAGTATTKDSDLAGGGAFIAIAAAIAVVVAIVIVASDDDDSDSN